MVLMADGGAGEGAPSLDPTASARTGIEMAAARGMVNLGPDADHPVPVPPLPPGRGIDAGS